MKYIKDIRLEINKEKYDPIIAKQADTARYLLFRILDNGVPFNLQGKTVRARAKKPDGKEIFNDLNTINSDAGLAELKLTNQLLALPGWVKTELRIYEGKDVLSTIPFVIDVVASVGSDASVESTNEFTALTLALSSVQEWDKYFDETSGKIEEKYTPRLNELSSQMEDKAKLTINYDDFGEVQNKNEEIYTYPNRINFGELNEAPLVKNIPNKGMDIIGHWYNDFGLEYTASSENQANGSYVWYDWSWNHKNKPNYDPKRHPLLGWYKGDDTKVLDWICYWLSESGVNVVSLTQTSGFDSTNWSKPSNIHYWEYQLMNNSKNFKALKYILSLKSNSNKDTLEVLKAQNDMVVQAYNTYKNVYTYNINNKKYACVFAWDLELIRGSLDSYNGFANTNAYLIALSENMKNIGYDGVCVMARGCNSSFNFNYLKENDVILLRAEYSSLYNTSQTPHSSYEDYTKRVNFPTTLTDNTILNVLTSTKSKNHPSNWNIDGSTPKLFKDICQNAINHIDKYKMPRILTIYNVSEWGEGGASLQPNMADGFGYLDSIKGLIGFNNPDNIEIDKIKKETKKDIFINNKDWLCAKITNTTLNGGTGNTKTVREFSSLAGIFNYNDKLDDYVFIATIQCQNSTVDGLSCYIYPSFTTGRIYAVCNNLSGLEVTNVSINLMVRKINV